MPKITIIHVRDANFNDPNTHYIGRAVPRKRLEASPYSNPFRFYSDRDREVAVKLYADHLKNPLGDQHFVWIREHAHELVDGKGEDEEIFLACWCAPQRCHGEPLRDFLLGKL